MTSEEAIRDLADTLQEAHSEALRLLREFRCAQHDIKCVEIEEIKSTKLDRSRWEGCRFCKGDLEGYTTEFKDVNGKQRRLFIQEGKAMIVAPGKYNYKLCIPIKYCPFCSCPLTEEAWAELERRIERCLT